MRSRVFCSLVLILLVGCSSRTPVPAPVAAPAAREEIVVDLAALLTTPREELAKRADELADRIRFQERSLQEKRTELSLLPTFRLPFVVPVFREAKFSAKAGFSLPPYATESMNSVLAAHLARFGDHEAARNLGATGDGGRNYPVEWTRLVALMQHDAQMRTAAGDSEGMKQLIALHQQLNKVLEGKAANGPLGAALLPRGLGVLTEAAVAWRQQNRPELAADAEKAVQQWGKVPVTRPLLATENTRQELENLLGCKSQDCILAATDLIRAFDLLAIPMPHEGARSVVAFFDAANRCPLIQVTYRDGMGERYPHPRQLAALLEEAAPGKDQALGTSLRLRTYTSDPENWEVYTITHRVGVGAMVRCARDPLVENSKLARDLGIVHLDRGFEQNRIRFAPEQSGDALSVKQPKTLAHLSNPLGVAQLSQAFLQRESTHDLVARVVMQYAVSDGAIPELHQLAMPLWSKFGPSDFVEINQKDHTYLALRWRDARTEYALRLPCTQSPLEWEARDRRTGDQLAERVAESRTFDEQERQARLKSGQPLTRIPRSRERLVLGMSSEQVHALLPFGRTVQKRDIPNGLMVTMTTEPAANAAAVPREILARFDTSGKLAELRVRYVDGLAAKGRDPLTELTRTCGASRQGPAPSAVVWADLPRAAQAPILHQWQDDLSSLTCKREGGVTEVILRDRPVDSSADKGLPLLEYLVRGPTSCVLGMNRTDLFRQWNVTTPKTLEDGAVVLTPSTPRPYDALMVWFENERVVRIVARNTADGWAATTAQLAQSVSEAWGRDLKQLGWPARQEMTPQGILQGLGWYDGLTRQRIFWQDHDGASPRVYTEWKALAN